MVVSRIAKHTPLTHLIIYSRRGPHQGVAILIGLIILGGLIAGIILCNKYGLQNLNHKEMMSQHHVNKALDRRFGMGIGTGIFAGVFGGPLALVVIGLVILFVLGRESPLFYTDKRWPQLQKHALTKFDTRMVRKRYYMGVAAGAILGLVLNVLLMSGLARHHKGGRR